MIKMLRPFLAKLSNREKMAIGIGIGFIGIFIIVNLAIFPFVDARERLERSLASHTRSYDEIKQLRLEYLELQNRADNSKTRFNRRQRQNHGCMGLPYFLFWTSSQGRWVSRSVLPI